MFNQSSKRNGLSRGRWIAIAAALSLTGSVFAQSVALNVADNPVDLAGNYLSIGANGNSKATTDPSAAQKVIENSNGNLAKDGTFTPFSDELKPPAALAVDLSGKAFQFDVDFTRDYKSLKLQNTTFAAGAGSEVGTNNVIGEVEFVKASVGYTISFRSGSTVTPVASTSVDGTINKFRVRVVFSPGGGTANVSVTPLDGAGGFTNDFIANNLPVTNSITKSAFAAGFYASGAADTSRGVALLSSFLTTGGPNTLWLFSDNPYHSTNPNAVGVFQDVWAAPNSNASYWTGFSNPTQRIWGWQAITSAIFQPYLPGAFLGGKVDYSSGLPVFDTDPGTLGSAFDGMLYRPNTVTPYRIWEAQWSFNSSPGGTEESHFVSKLSYGLTGVTETTQKPTIFATDPDTRTGSNAPLEISTLQGSGFANVPTTLRDGNSILVDNTPPNESFLKVTQNGSLNPSILYQGPVDVKFRAEDLGINPSGTNNGSGLGAYPVAVLRPASDTSLDTTVKTSDYDLSTFVYPDNDQIFSANFSIGTPGAPDVPCGKYRLITWVVDRVGLKSTPSVTFTQGNPANGYNGATDIFEVRKFNSLNLNITVPGFNGSAPDALHANPARFQRWVTIKIGGNPNGTSGSANSPVTYQKYVLLDSAGNGTVKLSVANGDVLPCPGGDMWVSVKDQQHTLRRTVPIKLVSNTSDYSADVALTLGDLNNDNIVNITDFGIFLNLWNTIYTQNDITQQVYAPHADMSGNRRVGAEDYLFILNKNTVAGDKEVGSWSSALSISGGSTDPTRVRVAALFRAGVWEAARYDMNNDGWVTWSEMEQVLKLKMAHKW